ncbi:MAG: type III secretion system chaperone [Candidatus Competibacteraceae bacterium]
MTLADALTEMGNRLGIGDLELDQNGGCLLAFDDDLMVDIEKVQDEPGFYLTATVGAAPHDGREVIFAELLEANLQGRGASRACFALDGDLDEIVLNRYIDRDDIEVDRLEQELETFLTVLQAWKQRYSAGEIGNLRGPTAANSEAPLRPGAGIIRG